MGTNQRFHCTHGYYLEHSSTLLNKAVTAGNITSEDRELIKEYIDELAATSQISPTRRYKLTGILIRNRKYHPAYADCTLKDIYAAINVIKTATKEDGTPRYKKNTISDLLQLLKRFFIWLVENGKNSHIPVDKLYKIKTPGYDYHTLTAEALLTEEEIRRIVEAAATPRDRALISVLYEGAFRIGEIGNMRWGDVMFTEWNVTINTAEKTGKPRFVPLVSSRAYLAEWKNAYPLPITPESFVFLTTTTKKPLQYQGLVKQMRIIATRAGITKHIKPHIFRHSRITHLMQKGVSEASVKLMGWGDTTTDMLKVYLHLTNADIEKDIARLNGITLPDAAETKRAGEAMNPIQCPRCASINPPTAKYCIACGKALVESEAAAVENLSDEVRKNLNDPAFIMAVVQAMRELEGKKTMQAGSNKVWEG